MKGKLVQRWVVRCAWCVAREEIEAAPTWRQNAKEAATEALRERGWTLTANAGWLCPTSYKLWCVNCGGQMSWPKRCDCGRGETQLCPDCGHKKGTWFGQ